jgi:hypothetical protein
MKQPSSILLTGAVFLCLLLISLLAGCTGTGVGKESNTTIAAPAFSGITLVELYHFHGNQQCYSCVKLGDMAEEVVRTYYPNELASGQLVFGHINAEDPKNRELAEKYEVSASSLMIGVYTKDSFAKQEIIQAWYRMGDKEAYATLLRSILDPVLTGEQS